MHSRFAKLFILLLIITAVPLTVYVAQQRQDIRQRASENTPTSFADNDYPFGIGDAAGISAEDMENIGAKWIINWGSNPSATIRQSHREGKVNFVPMFRTGVHHWKAQGFAEDKKKCTPTSCPTNRTAVTDRVKKTLDQMKTIGNYYIISNEPNTGGENDSDSDGAPIPLFTDQFEILVEEIKKQDPSAKIVGPSLIGWNHLKAYNWYNSFIAEYKKRHNNELPPTDILNIHLYDIPNAEWRKINGKQEWVFRGSDTNLLIKDLNDFRKWADSVGYANRPIWITEFGIIHCDTAFCAPDTEPVLVNKATHLIKTMLTYFNENQNRLKLQRWFIFTSYWKRGTQVFPIKLFDKTQEGNKTIFIPNTYGKIYKEYSLKSIPTFPPFPTNTPAPSPITGDIDGNRTVDLKDFELWKCEFEENNSCLQSQSIKQADLDTNNKVDLLDYIIWRSNYNKP